MYPVSESLENPTDSVYTTKGKAKLCFQKGNRAFDEFGCGGNCRRIEKGKKEKKSEWKREWI